MNKFVDTVTVTTFHFKEDIIQVMEKDIDDIAKDKAPGLDGLTVEFYLTFWYLINFDFVDLVKYCHKKGRLRDSMRALVRLLFKNRGERSDIKQLETYQSSQR